MFENSRKAQPFDLVVPFPFEDAFGVRSRTSGSGSMEWTQNEELSKWNKNNVPHAEK